MSLLEVRAQDRAIGTLRRALAADRVPHAYLFTGPSGVGKGRTAQSLAMTLNCAEMKDDACGRCPSCRKALQKVHPDVITVSLPEKKTRIPIDAIRELGQRLGTRPHEGRAKVAIIDPADMMSEQAANALLKTLEEPRSGSFLILITSRSASLLPTVRSRCQLVRFRPLPEDVVADLLVSQGVEQDKATVAAALSGGSVEKAWGYLGEAIQDRIQVLFQLLDGALQKTPMSGLKGAEALRGDREEALLVLDLLMVVLSEVVWLSSRTNDELKGELRGSVLASQLGEPLLRAAQALGLSRATRFISAAHRAMETIRRNNANPQLALEGLVMSMRGQSRPL